MPGQWITATDRVPTPEDGVTIYVHGGGFSISNPPLELVMAQRLSEATGRPAFAVDYRLAPAHPFPAAIDDVVAVYRSLCDQGVPAERILLVGESAGGTLVLSILLVLAAAGDALPGGVISVSPVTDFVGDSPSIKANEGRDVINPAMLGPIATQYLAGARPDVAPQSPIYGELGGLSPILLAVGADELLLDDSRRFAAAAEAAGTPVTLDIYQGLPHVFHAAVLVPAADQLTVATTYLRRVADWISALPARGRI
ncbi:alpha/beta hydrolase [Fodinicola feengrottensis]|uniref:alpha/beta hydrolase n=1 Tax=Fodinicola feengrottensis TaxID=435914 RepID=UPI00244119BC|nr:alpha/beta hydrolase [Fodinicola feengrottensis]